MNGEMIEKNKTIKVYVVSGDISYTNLFLDKVKLVDTISEADIVLFTGGEDVNPDYYGECIGQHTQINKKRDAFETIQFNEAREYGKFCVGICRGAQFCTVMSGGALIQHVTGHAIHGTHKIHLINEDVDIDITSTHHQMMYPFYLDKKDYIILAKAKHNLSSKYLNGDDCNRSLHDDFVEPEIVYYKNTNCLCVQGHPEYMPKDSSAVKYINVLIREYLEDTVEKTPKPAEEVQVENVNGINIDDDGFIRINRAADGVGLIWQAAADLAERPRAQRNVRVNVAQAGLDDEFDHWMLNAIRPR